MSAQTLSVTLTYGDENQFQRDGAAMFRYSDVQGLLYRLRSAIKYKTGETAMLRFVAAGEQGDRNGRCHWHLILFSKIDITTIGEIKAPWGVLTDRAKIVIPSHKKPFRVKWDQWPHGYVSFQDADAGGISYAISYALKDQFTTERSKGFRREAKTETFATGCFKMSKTPPIGEPFLRKKLSDLSEGYAVLPNSDIRVPDLKGYWRPTGQLRDYLLTNLRRICEIKMKVLGTVPTQWSSLLAACKGSEKDMEILNGEKIQTEDLADLGAEIRARAAFNEGEKRSAELARRCSAVTACSGCLALHPLPTLRSNGIESFETEAGDVSFRFRNGDKTGERLKASQSVRGAKGINALCTLRRSKQVARALPQSARNTFGS